MYASLSNVPTDERPLLCLQRLELATEVEQCRGRETSANLAGVDEAPVVVIAHQQGPYPHPATGGVRKPPDHELLTQGALEFQPVR